MNAHVKVGPTTMRLGQLKHGHEYPGVSLNARSTDREQDLDALMASIKAEGVLQSLLVCPSPLSGPAGTFYVIAGNRRLAALRKLKWDSEIPVIVRDAEPGSALAMSLAENVTQCPLHPVDRYETFAALIKSGKTEADIAASYAISERVVKQSLALGRLATKILLAWRKGDLDADGAKAFTLASDLKAQEAAFDKLKKNGRLSSWSIREALIGDQSETKRLLIFVGREAYEKAGGRLQEDLFARHASDPKPSEDVDSWDEPEDDGQFLVSDFALLVRVAGEKIKAKCDGLVKEGWAWAADKDDLPQGAIWNWRKIENASSKAPAKQKARAGCSVEIDWEGKLKVEYGLIKPGKVELSEDATISSEPAAAEAVRKAPKGPAKISNALDARLEEQLTQATKDALKAQSDGKDLSHLLASIVSAQILPGLPTRSPQQVSNALAKIRELLPAKDLNAAIAKRFDVKGYFTSAPKPIVIKAVNEMGHADQAKKLAAGTKAAAWKWAIAHHKGTGWLPTELRTVHYKGPGAKKGR